MKGFIQMALFGLLLLGFLAFLLTLANNHDRTAHAQEYRAWAGTVAAGMQMFEDNYVRCYSWYNNPAWCFEKRGD